MKLKGKMVMELTDVNTQEVETITEENMVTDAVNNILGINPMGHISVKRNMIPELSGWEICFPSAQT